MFINEKYMCKNKIFSNIGAKSYSEINVEKKIDFTESDLIACIRYANFK